MDSNQAQANEPGPVGESQCDKGIDAAPRRLSLAAEQELRAVASLAGRTRASISKLEQQEEEDDNNVVVPAWPSRSDAAILHGLRAASTETVQHQVYSLKDYSQVQPAGSCKQGQLVGHQHAHHQASGGVGKLLKSMSQDQKFGPPSKRMSESSSPSSQQTFAAESRIGDRVRKLFISPLSLRSASNSASVGSAGTRPASKLQMPLTNANQARLSIQSSASNVLNKPHHLMHAMYQRGQVANTGVRRSPMSQKQVKSFRVYGCPLQMANNIYPITCFGRADIYKQQSVPYVLARLCNYIEENSSQLTHEGIFRVSGNARLMEKLRTLFDHLGDAPLESESVDVATSASMLKMYLRELPEPLIPTRMNYYFITLAKKYSPLLLSGNALMSRSTTKCTPVQQSGNQENDPSTTNTSENPSNSRDGATNSSQNHTNERHKQAFSRDLTKLIRKLPIENYNLLKYLACFLHRITLKQQYNKMCAEALGIVFGPNVFRIRSESYKGLKEQEFSNQIMASIISNYRTIFDSELTDPLGNLVDLDVSDRRLITQQPGTSKMSSQVITPTQFPSDPRSSQQARSCSNIEKKVDPTSGSPISLGSHKSRSRRSEHKCCPDHCEAFLHPNSGGAGQSMIGQQDEVDLEDEEGEEDNIDDEDDDRGDDDDDDSYTRSSASESYCSSTEASSDSLNSPYDTEAEMDASRPRRRMHNQDTQASDDEELSDTDIGSNFSTSDCVSETSYTPSSSRSIVSASSIDEASSEPCSPMAGGNHELPTKTSEAHCDNPSGNAVVDCCVAQAESSGIDRVEERAATSKEDTLHVGKIDSITKSSFRASRNRRVDTDSRKSAANAQAQQINYHPSSLQKGGNFIRATRQRIPRQPHRYTALSKRRSSSASSLSRIRMKLEQPISAHQADGSTSRRARGSGRRSRTASGRAKLRPLGRRSSGRARSHLSEELDWVEHATDRRLMLADIYRSDMFDCDRHFLLRPFNSDETLLASTALSNGTVQVPRHPDEQSSAKRHMDQLREKMQQRRRYSGFDEVRRDFPQLDFVELLQQANQERIFEDVESVVQIELSSMNKDQQERSKTSGDFPHSGSYVSLLDTKLANFKPSELSLDQDSSADKSATALRLTSEYPSAQDPLIVQMRATKRLLKSLRKTLKHGFRQGYSNQLNQLLSRLALYEASPPDYSDDCLASYADYLSAQNLAQELEESLQVFDLTGVQAKDIDVKSIERLNELLNIKITLFKQRYNDLKSIRDHFIRSHCSCGELESCYPDADMLGPMQHDQSSHYKLTSGEKATRSHGSLDTLRFGSQDCSMNSAALAAHRDRKYSVPNRARLVSPERLSQRLITDSRVDEKEIISTVNRSISSISTSTNKPSFASPCKFGPLCPIEFVFNIERLLASKRKASSRLVSLNEMSIEQLQAEKLELQKNLLRFEHWFGRPASRLEFSIVGHLYERYRAVKMIKVRKQMISR